MFSCISNGLHQGFLECKAIEEITESSLLPNYSNCASKQMSSPAASSILGPKANHFMSIPALFKIHSTSTDTIGDFVKHSSKLICCGDP